MKINKIGYAVYALSYSFIVFKSEQNLKGCMFSCCVYSKSNGDIALNTFYRLFEDGNFTKSLS